MLSSSQFQKDTIRLIISFTLSRSAGHSQLHISPAYSVLVLKPNLQSKTYLVLKRLFHPPTRTTCRIPLPFASSSVLSAFIWDTNLDSFTVQLAWITVGSYGRFKCFLLTPFVLVCLILLCLIPTSLLLEFFRFVERDTMGGNFDAVCRSGQRRRA